MLELEKVKEFPITKIASWNIWMKSWKPGEGNGDPLQHSCLENPTDRGAWWATVRGVTESQTRLSDFSFFHFPVLYSRTLLSVHPVCNSLPLPTPNSRSIPLLPLPPWQPKVWSLCPWVLEQDSFEWTILSKFFSLRLNVSARLAWHIQNLPEDLKVCRPCDVRAAS